MLLAQVDATEEIVDVVTDPSLVDRVFEAGPVAIVGVAFALVLLYLGKQFIAAWREKGGVGHLEKTYNKTVEELGDGLANQSREEDRVHNRIDRVSREGQEFQVDMAGKLAGMQTTIDAQEKRLDRIEWPNPK